MAFCNSQENLVKNMVKKWILQQKQEKMVQKKPAEATGDLIGNKIADKTTSLGKTKS